MILDSGGIKHFSCGYYGIGIVVLVGVVNYFAYAGLDQGLGTFVTRE